MRFAVYLLVLLTALTFFAGLGRPAISDSDEAFYAEAGREMVETGDWLTPHFNYEYRFQKPILFYWVVAASYAAAGVTEGAARFGSALAGLGIVLITFACGRRWYDDRVGLLAGVIVATSFGAVSAARLSLPDLPLAFFITLTTWAAFVALFDRQRKARSWWLVSALGAAFGFLTKGPLALLIPALVLAGPVVLERGWRRVHVRHLLLAAALFLVVAAPWYVAMTQVHGVAYLRGFFIGDNIERFATTAFNPHRSVLFYVPIVLGGMLPWSPFFALGVMPLSTLIRRRQWPSRPDVRVLSWALLPFLLFTASVGKQPRYILPMLAPLGLLLAIGIRRAMTTAPLPFDLRSGRPEQRRRALPDAQPRLFRWMTAVSGTLAVLLAALLWRARPLLFAQPPGRVTAAVVALVVAGLIVLGLAASRRWRHATVAVAVVGALFVLVLRLAIVALPGLDPVEQMAQSVIANRQSGERVASYHVFVRNLVFYTHVQQADLYTEQNLLDFLDSPDRVLCVLTRKDLERIEAASREGAGGGGTAGRLRLHRLDSITYFEAPTAKVRSLLWPDADRDLTTAVLVSNR